MRSVGGGGDDMDVRTELSIMIDAPIEKVWEAITTPELIKRWFFGVDTSSEWTVGSPLVHTGEYQGKPYEDKGTILEMEPPRLLVHSHWSSVSGLPDAPENHERVAYELSERDGGTELTIRESNLASEDAKSASEQGWRLALGKLKEVVEG
jgi:uncharacterized protein YndB with AHSA1/START domain